MTLAAGLAPWLSAVSSIGALAVTMLALALGAAAMRDFLQPRFVRIAFRDSGWALVDRSGDEREALLESHRRLGSWVSLGFCAGGSSHFRTLIGPDNLDAPTRRRLVLLLSRAEIVQHA